MSNPAFDLASLAQGGKPADKLPARSRRRSQNPFTDVVRRVAEDKLTWQYPAVSNVADNGETSVAQQVENGIRQAGNALDKADKENGGPGWRTVVRKQTSPDGAEVTITFTVERRAADGSVEATGDDTGEAPATETTARRSRRSS